MTFLRKDRCTGMANKFFPKFFFRNVSTFWNRLLFLRNILFYSKDSSFHSSTLARFTSRLRRINSLQQFDSHIWLQWCHGYLRLVTLAWTLSRSPDSLGFHWRSRTEGFRPGLFWVQKTTVGLHEKFHFFCKLLMKIWTLTKKIVKLSNINLPLFLRCYMRTDRRI